MEAERPEKFPRKVNNFKEEGKEEMAKIQPVMQEFNTMAAPDATDEELANLSEAAARKISRPKKTKLGEVAVTEVQSSKCSLPQLAAVKMQVEAADKIAEQNARLTEENAKLEEKLAEYITELNELKEKVENKEPQVKVVEKIVEKRVEVPVEKIVEKIVEKPVAGVSDETLRLREEVRRLQNENDEYLMKISELTFDNARLTASIQEHNVQFGRCEQQVKQQPVVRTQPSANVYRSPNANGYIGWN